MSLRVVSNGDKRVKFWTLNRQVIVCRLPLERGYHPGKIALLSLSIYYQNYQGSTMKQWINSVPNIFFPEPINNSSPTSSR